MKVEKIEIEFSISLDYMPNKIYVGLITKSDVNAHRLNDNIEGHIQVSYRTFQYSNNVLIAVNFIKDNLIKTIDGTFPANDDRIIELINALDNQKVTHLFVGYPGNDGKIQRVGSEYYPVSYLKTE